MPRPAVYSPAVLALIGSTSYGPIPSLEDLEAIRSNLAEHAAAISKEDRDRDRAGRSKASPGIKVKRERTSASPAPSNISSASFRPTHTHATPITYGGLPKKKKPKRVIESDDEGKDRISSPPTHHTTSTSGLKLKVSSVNPKSRPATLDPSPTPSTSTPSAILGASIDFSLPPVPSRPLIPIRPGIQKPPKPGPKRQSEVDEDFSNVKAPNQVALPTFWSGIDPYLRDIREDDLAMLNFRADAPESFEIPPKGRHYSEIWDEEDGNPIGTTARYPVPNLRSSTVSHGHGALPLPHFTPADELRDANLIDEQRGLGSMTERIVAAVMGTIGFRTTNGGTDKTGDEDAFEGNRHLARVDVVDLEDRVKKELRGVQLLGDHEEFDPSNRDDDEITSALRQCQRLLHQQISINEARKGRLAEIAKHRLAYGEFQTALDGIEKSIEAAWTKRVKKYGASSTTKRSSSSSGTGAGGGARPPIPENLKKLVKTRQKWIESVGATMRERPRGDVVGFPEKSVYDGIGEEMDARDEKTVEEAVEVEMESVADEGDGA